MHRTSSRRVKNTKPANLNLPSASPIAEVPYSPLLHTQFRTSTAESSRYDGASTRTLSWDGRTADTESQYSPSNASTFRPVTTTGESIRSSNYDLDDITAGYHESWRTSEVPPNAAIPMVVVSTDPEESPVSAGRERSRVPNVNFSRPVAPPVDRSDERKREVLLRNAYHAPPSPKSVYSDYSFYQLPSPTNPTGIAAHPAATSPHAHSPSQRFPSRMSPRPHYLQLGIQHHLENRLAESAACFEKSATLHGGCGVGMLMWGLAQRHGWGCAKDEAMGFRWLRRAAETAVTDLEKRKQGVDMGAVKTELVMAIYEVGQSFYRGWGIEKDKEMAVNYFRVAARLGDPDAQQELAFCLLNGKGCKKDKREAAKWYRAAVAQGISDIGLAWIYKDKYQ
ncbi:Mitosis inhibitor nif1 [Grifola frondosa]|uniref:Mitosis inhibitor nif1 n=1 Tax=Grifola frondosa TaxID=5627 RepID=A0A1C7MUI2_GRIFR|nr:Mitosis inhibitor nif1 [Grifola frondosa]